MTKQLNVVDHKIKLFKAPLPPPRYPKGLPSGRAKRYPLGRRKTLAQLRVLGLPSSVFWVYPAPCSGQGNTHQEIALTESIVVFLF